MVKVKVNNYYLNNYCPILYHHYVSAYGELEGIYDDFYRVYMQVKNILTDEIDTIKVTIPSQFIEYMDGKEIKVRCNFGKSRFSENSNVIFMYANEDGIELYTEKITDKQYYDDIDDNEIEELITEITHQARQAGINPIFLNFIYLI